MSDHRLPPLLEMRVIEAVYAAGTRPTGDVTHYVRSRLLPRLRDAGLTITTIADAADEDEDDDPLPRVATGPILYLDGIDEGYLDV